MLPEQEWIHKTTEHIKNILANDPTGHDWWHIYRVHKMAKYIAEQEKANAVVVELAALLHDISDWKLNGGDEKAGGRVATEWLLSIHVDPVVIQKVSYIIDHSSFKGAGVKEHPLSLEGQVLQDADRLDALGAIGIARAFAYGGYKNRLIHDPNEQPQLHNSFEEYKKNKSSTINHFYEKLLLLHGRMNTGTAKKIAIERHNFMKNFMDDFFKEWDFNSSI